MGTNSFAIMKAGRQCEADGFQGWCYYLSRAAAKAFMIAAARREVQAGSPPR
jgi:hypothetical protein